MKNIITLFALAIVVVLNSCSGSKEEILQDPEIDATIQVELGHYWNISDVAFSPDGKTIASTAYDGKIIVWDYASKHQVFDIKYATSDDYTANYLSVSYTSDGLQIIAGKNNSVDIFDAKDGTKLKSIEVSGFYGEVIAISSDDKFAAVEGSDDIISIIDLASGTVSKTFEGHTSSINQIDISPDGKMLASAAYDSTACIWNIETGELVKKIDANDEVKLIAFNTSSDKFVLHVDDSDEIEIWDLASMKKINSIETDPESFMFSGENLLVHEYSKVVLYNIETQEEISSYEDYGYNMSVNSNNSLIVTTGSKGIVVTNLNDGSVVSMFGKDTRYVSKVHVSPTGKFIVTENSHKSGSGGPDILSYAIDTSANFSAYPTSGSGYNILDFYGNTDQIFAEESYGEVVHYDLTTGNSINMVEDKYTDPICITSDGALLIGEDKENSDTYAVFKTKTGEIVKELITTSAYHYFSGITPDDKYFVMLTMDFFKVWEISSGKEVATYEREEMDGAVFIDMTADGKYVIGRADSYDFFITDIMTGENIFFVEDINPKSAALNTDKNTVAVACDDWSVKVFDIAANKQTQTLEGHSAVVTGIAYTPNGKFLLSAAQDNQLLVWDNTGKLALTIIGLEKLSDYEGKTKDFVVFAPNGRYDGTEAGIEQFLYFDKNGERKPASEYKDQCYTPNLIGRTLGQNFAETEEDDDK